MAGRRPFEVGPGLWRGDSAELAKMKPVGDVIAKLFRVSGIQLWDYDIKVTHVYAPEAWPSRPRGFDFWCYGVDSLIKDIEAQSATGFTPETWNDWRTKNPKAVFNEDKHDSLGGTVSAGVTHGRGFRQIGTGEVLHIEIQLNGKCNAHLDSHGYVTGPDEYDWGLNALRHGYWDLLSDTILSPLYFRIPDGGQVGPMFMTPTLGLDREVIWNVIGIQGYWGK